LRSLGYTVSSQPFVVSPHKIPPSYGGTPQARERVFITGTRTNTPIKGDIPNLEFPTDFELWEETSWDLYRDLPIEENNKEIFLKYRISHEEVELLDAWDSLITELKSSREALKLPGFPLWSDLWGKKPIYEFDEFAPDWKKSFEDKNLRFYEEHKSPIDYWFKNYPIIRASTPSKRKFEWQAQELASLWDGLIHFRPSGVRVKKANYVPALVAITQTTILGKYKRRITPREAARLQGLKEDFSFFNQSDSSSYKQLGNGVSVGAVYQVVKALARRDYANLNVTNRELLQSIEKSSSSPNSKAARSQRTKSKPKSNKSSRKQVTKRSPK
jgi:DNA (cytosine-5)-methyltransferase 1